MTCQRIKYPPTTVAMALKAAGYSADPNASHELLSREVLPGGEVIMCGDGPPVALCPCGYISTLLCDYPVGDGKTCDLPLCERCAKHIGDDLDLCRIHAIEHRANRGMMVVR